MNPRPLSWFRPLQLLPLLGIALAGYFGVQTLAAQRTSALALRARIAAATTELATLRRDHAALAREQAQAEAELRSLQESAAAARAAPASSPEATARAWLARAKQLKRAFADQPDYRIPELDLLTEREWLQVGRTAQFDTDAHTRRSLAAARDAAKLKFVKQLAAALDRFKQANARQLPLDASVLAPYFDPPADATLLQRYAPPDTAASSSGRSGPAFVETSAIDADYDARVRVYANGSYGSEPAPAAWIDGLSDRLARAYHDYARDHYGALGQGIEQLAPYLQPPLDDATFARLLKAEREREGSR